MSGITNLSRTGNKAVLEAAILLTLALATIIIIHRFQHVAADSPNPDHSVLLNTSNSSTDSPADPTSADSNTGSGGSSNSHTTKVTVNGQDIPVPQNGASSQTVPNDGGGTSTVDTSNQQSNSTDGSGTATNHSSTSINVNSSSSPKSSQGGN